jgi:hypothetical protein
VDNQLSSTTRGDAEEAPAGEDATITVASSDKSYDSKTPADLHNGTITVTKNGNTWVLSGTLYSISGWTNFNQTETDEQSGWYVWLDCTMKEAGPVESITLGKVSSNDPSFDNGKVLTHGGSVPGDDFILHVAKAGSTASTKVFPMVIKYTDGSSVTWSIDCTGLTLGTAKVSE